jgi:hypothetical protein
MLQRAFGQSGYPLKPFGSTSVGHHSRIPSRRATSWIGSGIRLGADNTTSTFLPAMARLMRPAIREESGAGSATGVGTSTNRSTSPPRAASSTREPKRRTVARSPACSATTARILTTCSGFSRIRVCKYYKILRASSNARTRFTDASRSSASVSTISSGETGSS